MNLRPCLDQAALSLRKVPADQLDGVDPNMRTMIPKNRAISGIGV